MIYGYARISTASQSIERQIRNISAAYPGALIVREVFTRTSLDRPEWTKILKRVKSGDTIVFDSVSRMSGEAEAGWKAYEDLYNRGVELVFLKEPHINTATYRETLEKEIQMTGDAVDYILEGVNRYLMALARRQIQLAFEQSEKEVQDLHQRTKEGIETARLQGKQIGNRAGSTRTTKKSIEAKRVILRHSKHFGGGLSNEDCWKLAGVSEMSFYKYLNELKNEKPPIGC
jgi:DNA invertase Pin-like site-specific DNA recombinase